VWVLLGEFDWEYAPEEEIFVLGVWEKGVLEKLEVRERGKNKTNSPCHIYLFENNP